MPHDVFDPAEASNVATRQKQVQLTRCFGCGAVCCCVLLLCAAAGMNRPGRRRKRASTRPVPCNALTSTSWMDGWSGRRDSNPRPSPWQGEFARHAYLGFPNNCPLSRTSCLPTSDCVFPCFPTSRGLAADLAARESGPDLGEWESLERRYPTAPHWSTTERGGMPRSSSPRRLSSRNQIKTGNA
jgi:hypothetical protein